MALVPARMLKGLFFKASIWSMTMQAALTWMHTESEDGTDDERITAPGGSHLQVLGCPTKIATTRGIRPFFCGLALFQIGAVVSVIEVFRGKAELCLSRPWEGRLHHDPVF